MSFSGVVVGNSNGIGYLLLLCVALCKLVLLLHTEAKVIIPKYCKHRKRAAKNSHLAQQVESDLSYATSYKKTYQRYKAYG